MTVETCPACTSRRLHGYPPSHATRHRNFRCRSCGLVGWADAHAGEQEVFGIDQLDEEGCDEWHTGKRAGVTEAAWLATFSRLESELGGAAGHRIYDVGTGDAGFLAVARDRGWEVGGNDLMEGAVALARRKHGIEVDLGDLSVLDVPPVYDAVTLWCVLAHVPYPQRLLDDCFRILRPGGLVFLQTPRRCVVDSMAFAALDATRGRTSRWVDRRVAGHHWLLQTDASMTALLLRAGFTEVDLRPRARYTLSTEQYLESLGVPGWPSRAAARTIDRMLDHELGPRIVLDAYARKPGDSSA